MSDVLHTLAGVFVKDYPRLCKVVQDELEDVVLETRRKCHDRLQELLEVEAWPFTMNPRYADSVKELSRGNVMDVLHKHSQLPASADANPAPAGPDAPACKLPADIVTVGKAMAPRPKDAPTDAPTDAEQALTWLNTSSLDRAIMQLQIKLYAYRGVVLKRVLDQISMQLRHNYLRQERRALAKRLNAMATTTINDTSSKAASNEGESTSDQLLALMSEEELSARVRKQLEVSLERLNAAKTKLRRLRNGPLSTMGV